MPARRPRPRTSLTVYQTRQAARTLARAVSTVKTTAVVPLRGDGLGALRRLSTEDVRHER